MIFQGAEVVVPSTAPTSLVNIAGKGQKLKKKSQRTLKLRFILCGRLDDEAVIEIRFIFENTFSHFRHLPT